MKGWKEERLQYPDEAQHHHLPGPDAVQDVDEGDQVRGREHGSDVAGSDCKGFESLMNRENKESKMRSGPLDKSTPSHLDIPVPSAVERPRHQAERTALEACTCSPLDRGGGNCIQ